MVVNRSTVRFLALAAGVLCSLGPVATAASFIVKAGRPAATTAIDDKATRTTVGAEHAGAGDGEVAAQRGRVGGRGAAGGGVGGPRRCAGGRYGRGTRRPTTRAGGRDGGGGTVTIA